MAKRASKLTNVQKVRLNTLDKQLKKQIVLRDYESARLIVFEIQNILRPTGHINKIVQTKNWLYELAFEMGEYDVAKSGLLSNREAISKGTRIYLEATTLLAICLLRNNEYKEATKYIQEVLTNTDAIRTKRTREEFHKSVIDRFTEEVALFSIKGFGGDLDEEEIHNEAGNLIRHNTEDQIYINIGQAIPQESKKIMFFINDFSKKQLPTAEILMLPSPQEAIQDESAGKSLMKSIERVVYSSLCDPNSEVYKAWCKNGMGILYTKTYIASAVIAAFNGLGIGIKALAFSVVAIIMRMGLDIFCDYSKPKYVMDIRNNIKNI